MKKKDPPKIFWDHIYREPEFREGLKMGIGSIPSFTPDLFLDGTRLEFVEKWLETTELFEIIAKARFTAPKDEFGNLTRSGPFGDSQAMYYLLPDYKYLIDCAVEENNTLRPLCGLVDLFQELDADLSRENWMREYFVAKENCKRLLAHFIRYKDDPAPVTGKTEEAAMANTQSLPLAIELPPATGKTEEAAMANTQSLPLAIELPPATGRTQEEAMAPDPATIKPQAEASMGPISKPRRLIDYLIPGEAGADLLTSESLAANQKIPANKRLQDLSRIYPSLMELDSAEWGAILKVSPQAILQTAWWKKNRKKDQEEAGEREWHLKGDRNEATTDIKGTRMNPRDITHNG